MPSTVSSNTRATRSRLSSPQRKPNGPADKTLANGNGGEARRTFLENWLEPQVQSRPSFQDHGLQRHGVLEGMAPLGALPSAALSKKLMAAATRDSSVGRDSHTPATSKKIILKRPNTTSNTPVPAAVIAVPVDEEEAGDVATAPPAKRRGLPFKIADDDDNDGDYKPKASTAGHQPAATATTALTTHTPTPTPTSPSASRIKVTRRSLAKTSPSRSASGSLQPTTAADENLPRSEYQEMVDKVVEAAVDEALRHFRYPTAWALRTLYDENSANPHIVSMFEQVFHQTATNETVEEFTRLVNDKKKEGKKDNKGCYYFVPPATNSRFTPHKPKPAPYADLVKIEVPKLHTSESDTHVSKKIKIGRTRSTPASGKKKKKSSSSNNNNSSARRVVNGMSSLTHPESPLRNRGRAMSVDSTSSLSSAQSVSHPDEIEDADQNDNEKENEDLGTGTAGTGHGHGRSRRGRGQASSSSPSRSRAPTAPQPIAARVRSMAAKKTGDVSPTPNINSPSPNPDSAAPGMPFVVDDPAVFPNLQTAASSRKTRRSGKNSSPAVPEPIKFPSRFGDQPVDETDWKTRYKSESRHCTDSTKNAPLSFVRGSSGDADGDGDDRARTAPPSKRKAAAGLDVGGELATPKQSQQASRGAATTTTTTRATRSSRKRTHDDIDDAASPTSFIFPPPPPPEEPSSSQLNSRAGTPPPRALKKARTGPRVKTSPMKKKTGPSAGVPRASGERGSPAVNGPPNNQDQNDDYCSSCGGNGELVCCDGCTRALHFKCIDPPLLEDTLPDEWYCNDCLVALNPAASARHEGAFGSLLNTLEKKNSSAFRLPGDVRGYFEGVKTGADGEYETVVPPVSKSKKRGMYDDPPDFFRIRTPEGKATLCHSCSTSATDNRPIIPCSICGLWWHIDCLDPPLANPPVLRTWRCPAHIDDLLAELPGNLAPAHKFRKIKGASVIKPAYRRGTVNNGFIEIDDDPESNAASGWNDVDSFGHVYRLPSMGVKLDFVSRIHDNRRRSRKAKPVQPAHYAQQPAPQPAPVQQDTYLQDSRVIDQALATHNLRAATGQVNVLIEAMLAQADANILSAMARGNAQHLQSGASITGNDVVSLQAARAQMEAMMANIDQQLAQAKLETTTATATETPQEQSGIAKKDEPAATISTPEPDESAPVVATEQDIAAKDNLAKADETSSADATEAEAEADAENVAMATPAATNATEEKQDIADIDMASNSGGDAGTEESTPKANPELDSHGDGDDHSSKPAANDVMLTPSTSPMATQAEGENGDDGDKTAAPASVVVNGADEEARGEKNKDWEMKMD